MSFRGVLAAALSALALSACGGGGEPPAESQPEQPTTQRTERAHRPADVPGSWTTEVNRRGGFSYAVPRGWRAEDRGRTSLVRSFDRLVAISIVADRRAAALELKPGEFARRTATELRGLRGEPRVGRVRRFAHPRYEGAEVRANAVARDGVRQRLAVIVLRRPGLVTVTAVIAANRGRVTSADGRLARAVVRTVRTRPTRAQRSGRSG